MAGKEKAWEPASTSSQVLEFGNDAALLAALSRNGRASHEDLARALGTSRQTAWRRLRALVGSVIWGFAPVIDHQKLGWRRYVITLPGSPDPRTIRSIDVSESAALGSGQVTIIQSYLLRGRSGWRFVVHLAAKNSLAMEAFFQTLRDRLPTRAEDWEVEEIEYVMREGGFSNPRRGDLFNHGRGGGDE